MTALHIVGGSATDSRVVGNWEVNFWVARDPLRIDFSNRGR